MVTFAYYSAPWCGPCKQFRPVFDEVVDALGAPVTFVDIDAEPDAAAAADVQSVPTIVVLRDGAEIGRFTGARPKAVFERDLQTLIAG